MTTKCSLSAAASVTRSRTTASSDWRFISGVSKSFASTLGIWRRMRSICSRCANSHSLRVILRPSILATVELSSAIRLP